MSLENDLLNIIADIKGNQEELKTEKDRLNKLKEEVAETENAIEDIEEQRENMDDIIEELTGDRLTREDQWGQPL